MGGERGTLAKLMSIMDCTPHPLHSADSGAPSAAD